MKWVTVAGAIGIAYSLGVRRGENSALKALCITVNGRDDQIYFLRRVIQLERTEFKQHYTELESTHIGLTSIVRLITDRLTEALGGVPSKAADAIIPLLEALDRASTD